MIIALNIHKLHGYIDKKISFNNSEAFLIGINGSGKSTILKIIHAILTKNLDFFNKITFSKIELITSSDIITVKKGVVENSTYIGPYFTSNTTNLTIKKIEEQKILSSGKKSFEIKSNLKLIKDATYALYNQTLSIMFCENSLILKKNDDNLEKELLTFMKNKVNDNDNLEEYFDEFIKTIIPIKKVEQTLSTIGKKSLQAKSLEIEYIKTENEITLLTEENLNFSDEFKEKIDYLNYLNRMKEKVNSSNFDFIDLYIQNVNHFFKDCYKKLSFNKVYGEFSICVLNKEKIVVDEIFDFEKLSSGEQQLLTLITELTFNLEDNTVILIDEPEESLHLEWQQNLLPVIRSLISNKKNIQLIIASHSSNFLSNLDLRESFIPLNPYNEVK